MASIRTKRVAEQIQEEISALLLKGIKDPRIGFVTITGVEVSPDFSKALVYFCSTGDEDEREQSREGLQSAAGFIRKLLGKRLRLKTIPEFQFRYDGSLDEGDRIERLLVEVREKEGWNDPSRARGSAQEVAQALIASQRVLVTSHTNPDGDAIGSILALGHLLKKMGKDVVIYNQDPVPANFRFLPGSEQITQSIEGQQFDTTVVADCSELSRVSKQIQQQNLGVIVGIDHHLTTTPLGEKSYLDPKASAIGEMIYNIMQYLPIELDETLAICIYTTILTDTGSFRYSNTSPRALQVASEMVAQGVSPWEVALAVYESQPLKRLELLGLVLKTLQVESNGRYGSIVITQDMFEQTQTSEDLIDGFINYPRSIEGVEVSVQFRQQPTRDGYKVSFRSRGRINVAQIANHFGGGGHANAAGCALLGSLESIKNRIREAVEESFESLPS